MNRILIPVEVKVGFTSLNTSVLVEYERRYLRENWHEKKMKSELEPIN